jgi:hypothetical protein
LTEETWGRLQPWHLLNSRHVFSPNERWGDRGETSLVAFAKRQDDDTLACLQTTTGNVFRVHGWSANGYDIEAKYESAWEWMKSVIDDCRTWSEVDRQAE